jgi:hypothetical protein
VLLGSWRKRFIIKQDVTAGWHANCVPPVADKNSTG